MDYNDYEKIEKRANDRLLFSKNDYITGLWYYHNNIFRANDENIGSMMLVLKCAFDKCDDTKLKKCIKDTTTKDNIYTMLYMNRHIFENAMKDLNNDVLNN